MRSSSLSIHWCIAGLIAVSLVGVARGQDYKIKMNRPSKVGDEVTAHVMTTSSQTVEANLNGQPMNKAEAFTAELRGIIKVLAVNQKTGGGTRLSCTVIKFTKDGTDLYPPGTVIVGEKVNKTDSFTIDGKPVDAANVPVLSGVLEITDPDRQTTDDQISGTDQPQKVGGTWPIDSEKLARQFEEEQLPIPAESLKGESKLVEIKKKANGLDVMTINSHVTADGFKSVLPGAAVTDGKLDVDAYGVVPLDESLPGISMRSKTHLSMVITPNNGGGPATTVTMDRDTTQEQQPVKK